MNRQPLIWIAVVSVLPIVLSTLLYYGPKPYARVNHGILIEPQRPIPTSLKFDGKKNISDLLGRWWMLSVDTQPCDLPCVTKLYFMRQICAAQGAERHRIQTVWIRAQGNPVPFEVHQAYHQTVFWIADAAAFENLQHWLPVDPKTGYQDFIYLIDPRGHLMMRFPRNLDPSLMKKDIQRLLKWSGIG